MLLRWTSVGCAVSTGLTSASVKNARTRRSVDAGFAQSLQGVRDAARLRRRSGAVMHAAAAILVHVLGEIGEQRKVGKGAHDLERRLDGQGIEQCGELARDARGVARAGTVQADRGLPDRLHAREPLRAGLLAQHLAKQAAEQAGIFLERKILVSLGVHGSKHRAVHGAVDCNEFARRRPDRLSSFEEPALVLELRHRSSAGRAPR